MSIIKRLLGKNAPVAQPPAEAAPAPAAAPRPRPDTEAIARAEEADVTSAIAAGDAAALGRWALEGSSTRVRQMAAQAVTDPEQVRELIRATRGGNDKNVHRILVGKRDALLAQERIEQERTAEIESASAALARHAERAYEAMYEAALSQLESRWQAVSGHASPELREEVAQRIARAHATIEQQRQAVAAEAQAQRDAALAAEEARRQREVEARAATEAAAAAAEARARASEAAREVEQAKREAIDAGVREMLGLLRQAQAAIDHGGTARAARLRDTIKEKLPEAPALPAWYARKLEEVDARIEEMKDWKTFTVVPKRADLLQRAHGLVGAEIAPEELARQIRRLRDEWKTLGRGAAEDPSPEWQEFDATLTRAYEPCRVHFAQQAEHRKQNQANREALLVRLAAFTARQQGDDVDWRLVQQVIAEAREEWQQYAPVEQSVAKDLQTRFHEALDELHGRLNAEYDRNVESKRALIARAGELSTLEDTRQAIDEAKVLQRAWKDVGLVPRQKDNALWEEFRRNCDAVFRRSQQEHAAFSASLEANQARATAICEALEQASTLTGEALSAELHGLAAMRDEFDALELPRASARELRQRFTRATAACHEATRRERALEAQRGRESLHAAAAHVRAYARAAATANAGEIEALRAAAEAAVAALGHAPKAARQVLEQQLARIEAGEIGTDFAANEAALRMLCIRAELIADVETPAEDLERRREYQMQRLVQSMGRGERPASTDLDSLALEWLATGPVDPPVHDALHARFERCRT